MKRLFVLVCVAASGSVFMDQSSAQGLKLVGHRTLSGAQAQAAFESDGIVCEARGREAHAEMTARLANGRRPNAGGSSTEFSGSTSDGRTFRGNSTTTPNDSSSYLGPGLGGVMEGRRQAEMAQAPNNAAFSAMLTCMTDRGWLFARQ